MVRTEFRAMGSKVLAILDSAAPEPGIEQVPLWFEQWEQVLSRFRFDSELCRLNARAGESLCVSETVWEVLATAIEAAALTDGLVNPLVLEAVVNAGYDRSFDLIVSGWSGRGEPASLNEGFKLEMEPPLPAPGSIVCDAERRMLHIPEGTGLDFGGVAKGWAAHQAMGRLSMLAPALVSAGGDVAVSGPHASGKPWRIGVEDPAERQRYLQVLYVERGGVATSGKDQRYWQRGGSLQHHIIDPRTRRPALTDVKAATVVASTVMRAEALAKAVLISGSGAGLELIEAQPDAEAILILDDGILRYSRDIEMYL